MIDARDIGPTGGVSGLSALQLEKLLLFTLVITLLMFGLGCTPGDWGAYKEQVFWHDRDHQSGGGP